MGVAHVRTLIASALLVAIATAASAHEIGTTQVRAEFRRDRTYVIDVVTAPQSLVNKLEAAAHHPRSPQLMPAQLHARILDLAPTFLDAVDARFGGTRIEPRIDVLMHDPAVTIRLTGDIPQNAREFTWQYNLAYSSYSLMLRNEGGAPMTQWLDADARSTPFPMSRELLAPARLDVIRQYLALGFTHIVPYGLDHILFVLGIFLLTTKLRPILMQVTAFTIAHSITLGLTIYGVVSLTPRIVEPAIALSIAYVAIENVRTSELKPWRVAIVFAFGLLHGMGFAGVLKELGLPRSEFLTALVTFNIGVELGQLAVIAVAFSAFAYWHRMKPWYRPRFVMPASMVIAAMGIFWTVQRVI